MARRRGSLLVALLVGAVSLGGCAEFDQASALEDLRVLAMRAEPAEVMYSALYLVIPPEDRTPLLQLEEPSVDVEVFAYDPRGGLITSTFQLCPPGEGSCLDYDPVAELEPRFEEQEAKEEVRRAYQVREREHPTPERLADPSGRLGQTRYTIDFTDSVIDTILRDEDGNAGISPFSILPRFVTEVRNQTQIEVTWERAFKRLPFTLDLNDPDLPPDLRDVLLDVLGLELCGEPPDPETFEEGPSECFYERSPNQNPDLLGFEFVDLAAEDEFLGLVETSAEADEISPPIKIGTLDDTDIRPRALLRINPGSAISLRPVFPEGTVEPYQIYSFDIDGQELVLENRFEDIVVSWYATHGSVPGLTSTQFGETLTGTFTAPELGRLGEIRLERGIPAEEPVRDSIVAVIRDQRGGVGYAQVDVEYREPAAP